jgi:hypothetical protein
MGEISIGQIRIWAESKKLSETDKRHDLREVCEEKRELNVPPCVCGYSERHESVLTAGQTFEFICQI